MSEIIWQLIDRDATLARLANDEELLRELAGYFLEDHKPQIIALTNAIASGDAAAVERAAHSLKGMAANLGARDVTQAASELELMGRNRDLTKSADIQGGLKMAIDRLVSALRGYLGTP